MENDLEILDIRTDLVQNKTTVVFPFSSTGRLDKDPSFLDYKYCNECKINSVLENDNKIFCLSCEYHTTSDGKNGSVCMVVNKFIHFKNTVKRLLTTTDNSDIVNELRVELDAMQISLKDIDSNFISKRLKSKKIYASKDYKKVFEILSALNDSHIKNLSEETFDQITMTFHALVLFVREVKGNTSINYNFFLDKIFQSVANVPYLQPQMVKNPYRNNENQLLWNRFVKHNNEEQQKKRKTLTKVLVPQRSQIDFLDDFECSIEV